MFYWCRTKVEKCVSHNSNTELPKRELTLLVSNQLDAQVFSVCVYFDTLHVSSNHVLVIRRLNCINTTSGICHSM